MSIKHWETPEAQALIERFTGHPIAVLHADGLWYAHVIGEPLYHIPPCVAICVLRDWAACKLGSYYLGVMWIQSYGIWAVLRDCDGAVIERVSYYSDQDEALLAALQKATA